jgi:AmmeMemoRadiSam system protein A
MNKSFSKFVAVWAAVVTLSACRPNAHEQEAPAMKPQPFKKIREAAVAGLFYPANAKELGGMIDTMLAAAKPEATGDLKAIICPHAGYPYSGPVAAYAYKLLAGRDVKTVLLLAPSHYAMFRGAYITEADVWRTPLGDVPISPKAAVLAQTPPFTRKLDGFVQRPDWVRQSPAKATAALQEDRPDTWEHAAEVEVPFLQKTLKNFELVPVIFGQVDPALVAQALSDKLDDKTIIVASSDLSHYHSYAEAETLDHQCVRDILDLKTVLSSDSACGAGPILAVIHLAKMKGWKPVLLDYRNSGDTSGDKSHGVVGYAAIAFFAKQEQRFSKAERKQLLDLARQSLESMVTTGRLPKVDAEKLPKKFQEKTGCFVTLTKRGQLRGCIGHIVPHEPLYKAIMDNAKAAALEDPRFPAVTSEELKEIEIEISVLTVPAPLAFSSPEDLLAKLRPHMDGVVLQVQGRGATYLPQVWSQLPDKVQFLKSLAEKAGCLAESWRLPGTQVFTYQVEAFHQSEF